MTATDTDTDILIAGGGLAGATLALALARMVPQLRVIVAETFPLSKAEPNGQHPSDAGPDSQEPSDSRIDSYQPSYDERSTALAWGSRLIFDQLGLWPALAQHAAPIRHIHVSDRGRFGAARLRASDYSQDALGYVVDNRWMGLCLMRELLNTRVNWLAPAEVINMTCHGDHVRVALTAAGEARELSARCLVVADGGRSGLRERLGFQIRHQPYGQNALIANVTSANSHQFAAYERFTDSGPMALLPHGSATHAGRQSALVWTLSDSELEQVQNMTDAEKCELLQQRFGWRLGRFSQVGECNYYPLALTLVNNPVRQGVALVGNAAHSLHPVAGQGFNLALRGLMTLVEQFRLASEQNHNPGELAVLQRYQQLHQGDCLKTAGFSDSLIRIFGSSLPPLAAARSVGLLGLDLLPAAKRWFAGNAMGLGGRKARIQRSGSYNSRALSHD